MQNAAFVSRDVQGDGSCFFRALYGVARKQHILHHLCIALQIAKPNDINAFIRSVRSRLARCIRGKKDNHIVSKVYSTLKALDTASYAVMIKSSFPSWFVRKMKTLPNTEDEFRHLFAKGVSKTSSWVSQIEVDIIKGFAQQKGIDIVILNREPTSPLAVRNKTLYLLNVDEVHYKYLVAVASRGDISKPQL